MLGVRIDVLYVLFLVCLTSLTDIKIGPVQVSEIASLAGLLVVGPMLLFGSRLPRDRLDRASLLAIIAFVVLSIGGSTYAYWTAQFYAPGGVETLLKQPGWISAARVFQLVLVYSCYSAILFVAQRDAHIIVKCVRLYVFGMTVSAIYGTISVVLLKATGLELGGAYGGDAARLRAFFVEGGPYGSFAVSGLIMIFAQWHRSYLSKWAAVTCGSLITVSLVLAQSKAAVFAMLITLLLALCFYGFKALRAYLLPILIITCVIVAVAVAAGAGRALETIVESRTMLLEDPELIGDDPNVVAGRVAGSFIVPEMIAAHPFLGIGLGNYSLMRNSPEYNRVLPTLEYWDLPGLGLYGFLAEIGLLGGATLVIFFLIPALSARRAKVPLGLVMLCCYPLVAMVFGVQATFLYPWVVFAVAVVMVRQYQNERAG